MERVLIELPVVCEVGVRKRYFAVKSFVDPTYVLTYQSLGESDYEMENSVYRIKRGMVSLMPPYLLHTVRPIGGKYRKLVAHFTLDIQTTCLNELPLVITIPADTQKHVCKIFHAMLGIWKEKSVGYETILGGMTAQLIGMYFQHASEKTSHRVKAPKAWKNIENSLSFIRGNLEKSITVHDVSRYVGLSSSYFSRLFHLYVGISPHVFINNCRVEKAKQLLLRGQYNCSEVADLLGFSTVHSFCRVFKRMTKVSPTDWMRQVYR